MSRDVVIRAEGLGKKYLIGHEAVRSSQGSFRETVVAATKGFGQSMAAMARGAPLIAGESTEEFWALKNVSFEVKRGEVLGVIGRNGAGKSTLLKILSRITEPTEGRVEIKGRVASLLEVGTGFHAELTGRENIYLNGAILGMSRAEITNKFDQIVDFAGIERFLDTPVKRYSSGMYVRLAFAVAAHLNPEILIVDEVLAVGDAEFQKKCLGKMEEVAGGGRTVLFVSHNMTAVRSLCGRAILLKEGRVAFDAATVDGITAYLTTATEKKASFSTVDRAAWVPQPWVTGAQAFGIDGVRREIFKMGEDVVIKIGIVSPDDRSLENPVLGLIVIDSDGRKVSGTSTRLVGAAIKYVKKGQFSCRIRTPNLVQGAYGLEIWLQSGLTNIDCVACSECFSVEPTDVYKTGFFHENNHGPVFFKTEWQFE